MKRVLLALCIGAFGCSDNAGKPATNPDGGGAAAIEGLVSIAVTPADQTLVVDGTTAVTATYQASGTFKDGHHEDVTQRVAFSVSSPLGSFSKNIFTSGTSWGGLTNVVATAGMITGTTTLTLQLKERYDDPASSNLPPSPAPLFSGPASTARAPTLVYPNDGVLLPPNLGKLEVHFQPGASNTLFELSFANAATDVRIYLRCSMKLGNGCIYAVDPTVWQWVAETNRGGDAVTVGLRGTDDQGSAVGQAATLSISFAEDDVTGGLYYWTTSNGTGIMRYDFAGAQTSAQQYLGTNLTGGTCVGCHALSHDGTKLVAEAGGQNDGRILLLDVASTMPMVPFGQPGKSIFESWNPDGSQYVGIYPDSGATDYNLQLFDGNTGALVAPIAGTGDSSHPADHPDWSADGMRIAYVKVGIPQTAQRMFKGAIEMISQSGTMWGAPVEIVPAVSGKNRYYPAFAPDDSFLVYNESVCASGDTGKDCDADSDPTARLWGVVPTAGAAPVELAHANAPGKADTGQSLATTFPKWSPFISRRTGEFGARLMWITFSSTRNYGLRPPPPSANPSDESATGDLLWMAAIDPDQLPQGKDPSYAAFALPFQDLTTSNHIAQWTTKVVPPVK